MEYHENKIISGLKAGEESSYNILFNEYYIKLSIFACRYVDDMEVARDLVQDYFVHLFEIRESLNIKTSLKSFLYQSVKNRCLNHIKHLQLHEKHLENLKATKGSNTLFVDKIVEAELENQIFMQLGKLPSKCQIIFKLSRLEGKKNQEIANSLNISKRTVETHISKALRILRDNLKDYLHQ